MAPCFYNENEKSASKHHIASLLYIALEKLHNLRYRKIGTKKYNNLSIEQIKNIVKNSIVIKKGIVKVRGVYKDGFYIINIKTPRGTGNIYITKDKKYTILGNVLNNKNGSPLSGNFPVNTSG